MCPRGLKQGDLGSPLVYLFINESANEITERGSHVIQFRPCKHFILMFADNVILALQNQLKILWETGESLGLVVNLDNSNIIDFRNWGHNASFES